MKEITEFFAAVLIFIIVIFGFGFLVFTVLNSFWPLLLEGIREIGEAWRG